MSKIVIFLYFRCSIYGDNDSFLMSKVEYLLMKRIFFFFFLNFVQFYRRQDPV